MSEDQMDGFAGMPTKAGRRVTAGAPMDSDLTGRAALSATAEATAGAMQPGEPGSPFPADVPSRDMFASSNRSTPKGPVFSKADLTGRSDERDYDTFEIPLSQLPRGWPYADEYRSASIVELDPFEEAKALDMAGQGLKVQQGFTEQVKASVYMVAGQRMDHHKLRTWWKAIGPRGRKCVERMFTEVNGIDDAVGESVLATRTPGRG